MPHTQLRIAESKKKHLPAPFSLASPPAWRIAVRCRVASCSACGAVPCRAVLCRAEPCFAVLSLSYLPENASKHTKLKRTSMYVLEHFIQQSSYVRVYMSSNREYSQTQNSTAQQRNPPCTKQQSPYTQQETKHVPIRVCLLYTSPSPRDKRQSRMPSSA